MTADETKPRQAAHLVKARKIKPSMRIWLIGTALVLLIGGLTGFWFRAEIMTFISDTKASIANRGKPKFVFNADEFPDWATAGNVWVDASKVVGNPELNDDLPIADISIHQCAPGSQCGRLMEQCKTENRCYELEQATLGGGCFVMAFYKDYTIEPNDAVAKSFKQSNRFGDVSGREIAIKNLTMNTPEGEIDYRMHYYEYTGSEAMKQGNALGFVALSSGHVEVRSICDKASQLDETLPVVKKISLAA